MIHIATWISNLMVLGVSLLFIAVSLFIIWVVMSDVISKWVVKRWAVEKMIGRNGKTDGSIKGMLRMMKNGKRTGLNVLEKTVMDGGSCSQVTHKV